MLKRPVGLKYGIGVFYKKIQILKIKDKRDINEDSRKAQQSFFSKGITPFPEEKWMNNAVISFCGRPQERF